MTLPIDGPVNTCVPPVSGPPWPGIVFGLTVQGGALTIVASFRDAAERIARDYFFSLTSTRVMRMMKRGGGQHV